MIFFNRISQTDVKQINNDDNRKPLVKGKVKDYARVVTVNDTKDAAVQVSDIKDLNIDDEQFEFNIGNKTSTGNVAANNAGTQPDNVSQKPIQDNINNTAPEINIPSVNEYVNNNPYVNGNKENNNTLNNNDSGDFNGQELIDKTIDNLKNELGDFNGNLTEGLKNLPGAGKIIETITSIMGYIKNPTSGAKDALGSLVKNVVGFIVNPLGTIGKLASGSLASLGNNLFGGLLDKFNNFAFGKEGDRTWLGNVVDTVKGWIGDAVEKVSNFILGEEGNRTLIGKAFDWAKDKYDAASQWVGNAIDTVKNFLLGEEGDRTFIGKAVDKVSDFVNDVKEWALGTKEDPTWLGKLFGYGYKDGETRVNKDTGEIEEFNKANKSWVVRDGKEYQNGTQMDDGAGNLYEYDAVTDTWSLKEENATITQYETIDGKLASETQFNYDQNGKINNVVNKKFDNDGSVTQIANAKSGDRANVIEVEVTGTRKFNKDNYIDRDGSMDWGKMQRDGWGANYTGNDAKNAFNALQNGASIDSIIKGDFSDYKGGGGQTNSLLMDSDDDDEWWTFSMK